MDSWSDYQQLAQLTAVYPDAGARNQLAIMYTALGLAGEAGEVANKVKKIYRDDNGVVTPERLAQIIKELGGTFWYLAMLMNELGVEGSEVLAANIDSLDRRSRNGTIHGDGDDREDQPMHVLVINQDLTAEMMHGDDDHDVLTCPFTLAFESWRRNVSPPYRMPGSHPCVLNGRGELFPASRV